LFQLRTPKIQAAFWHSGQLAGTVRVPVPKAAMNKNDLLASSEYKIWLTRNATAMKPVPVAEAMDEFSDRHLGPGVFAVNPSHSLASRFPGEGIGHPYFDALQ
jgi:hypothetical protein